MREILSPHQEKNDLNCFPFFPQGVSAQLSNSLHGSPIRRESGIYIEEEGADYAESLTETLQYSPHLNSVNDNGSIRKKQMLVKRSDVAKDKVIGTSQNSTNKTKKRTKGLFSFPILKKKANDEPARNNVAPENDDDVELRSIPNSPIEEDRNSRKRNTWL